MNDDHINRDDARDGIQRSPRLKFYALLLGSLILGSCTTSGPHRAIEGAVKHVDAKSGQTIRQRLIKESEKLAASQHTIRKDFEHLAPLKAPPLPIEPMINPLDAINITLDVDNADVRHVLRAIAEQSGMNLMLDPELSNVPRKATLHLRDTPASVVFRQVMQMYDLHGEVSHDILIVRPYEERTFTLDFLQTTMSADFSSGGDVFGASSGGGGGGGGGSSNALDGNFSLSGDAAPYSDPYKELEGVLSSILDEGGSDESLPGSDGAEGKKSSGAKNASVYALNKMTGTLYLRARPSKVNTIARLVARYREVLQRQVLIEARIVDVTLNDNYQFGIDWGLLRSQVGASYGAGGQQLGSVNTTLAPPAGVAPARTLTLPGSSIPGVGSALGIAYNALNGLSVSVNMLEAFGTVHVLSNPTLRTKNARPALINVGRSTTYVSDASSSITAPGGGASTTSANVTTNSVFDGIVIGVVPFIDDDNGVQMTIHPIQTQVDAASLVLQDVGNGQLLSLPIVDFKGMTTTLHMNDGDTILLGGLIDESGGTAGHGVPGVSEIPAFGNLFGGRNHSKKAREMVIILTVHVL